ncbi:methyltransferase family protein [Roseibium hamelinense]|uniref:Methyltransferase family protein n=1 Tax=Roseibium hamelinense TaxID=150831 RepID=A0A562T1N5_9HYPH|nr:class I SAM-dependent methyltransferase [Roseibium hamelinense]MTI43847.1 methyltransferase domain-containing protein [Roseibium hamelinense]TWI87068.1 methyltransferase family protein [Roseibium hamelinense]
MTDRNHMLERAIALDGDPDAIREFYSDWGKTYDTDLLEAFGYVGPAVAAEALTKRVGDTALVLDAGSGTGLVGIELFKRKNDLTIDGIDLTPEMLTHSRKKGVYRKLNIADMCGPLHEINDDIYDGTVSAGVFTNGHVGPQGLDELIRVTKSGGPVVITVRDSAWEADGFKDYIGDLEADEKVKVLEITLSPYHTKEGVTCQLVVLEVV